MATLRPSLRTYTVAGVRYIVGDVVAAREQADAHTRPGWPPCQCFDCLAARAVLSGKVMNTAPNEEDTAS